MNKLVQLQKNQYELSWNVSNAQNVKYEIIADSQQELHNAVTNEVTNIINTEKEYKALSKTNQQKAKETLIENEMKKIIEKASSEIIYSEILPGVDLKYRVSSGKLKEDIILKQYQKDFSINFQVNTKELSAKLEDNIISFYDKKDPTTIVFSTQAPFMYDQANAYSEDVKIDLIELENGYQLTLTPNDSWLSNPERNYPVVVDPIIFAKYDSASTKDTFTSSQYSTTNYYNSMKLGVGKRTTTDTNISFVKFDLPTLSTSSMVTKATFFLSSTIATNGGAQVNIHKMTSDWDSKTLVWNNMFSETAENKLVVDYKVINQDYQLNIFDITSVAKDWYTTGTNYGLKIKAKDTSTGYVEFNSSDNGAGAFGKPEFSVNYVDHSGLEGYYTYHSQDVLRAGTGFINDYNGNLIFIHDDLSMSGNLMPISINHVYNSNDRTKDGNYGKGWRLNLAQEVGPTGLTDGHDYYYIDADGTKQYFKKNTDGIYKDEAGMDLTFLKNADNSYTITDNADNKLKFNALGILISITDYNNNSIQLNYNSSFRLISTTDGAGRITTLEYNTGGKLEYIIDPAGRRTKYEYTNGQLTKITYSDGKITQYVYETDTRLKSVINHDGYKIEYAYSEGDIKRVSGVNEIGNDGTAGKALTIKYNFNSTSFTDETHIYKRKEIYQFNDYGNTISIKDDYGNALYYEYGTVNSSEKNSKNKITSQSKLQKTTINYIKNHNIEQEVNFTPYNNGGTGTSTFSADNESSYLGLRSLKITKTDNQNAQIYYQKFYASNENLDKTYTYSAYVRTQDISNTNGKGAYLQAWYEDNNGVIQSVRSKYLSGNHEWTRLETTLTIPKDIIDKKITIRVGIQSETGTAYFDNLQFEEGTVANRYNLVENGDFRGPTPTMDFWSKTGTATDTISTAGASPTLLDGNSFMLGGNSQTNKNINQTIKVPGKAKDIFVFSAWAKADSVPLTIEGRKFSLLLRFNNTDGSTTPFELYFNQDSKDWQYISGRAIADKEFNSITIYGNYDKNENTAYFDGFRLYKELFDESYDYDKNGNITSAVDIANQENTFEYDNKNLVNLEDAKGSNYQYEYTGHNLIKATTAENVVYSFDYDNKGNPTKASVKGTDLFTESRAAYTTSGNYLKTITAADGNTVEYNYNETKGILNNVTDGNGTVTTYTYDAMDRLESVAKVVNEQTITNGYSYEKDRLKSITHNGFAYNFGYDSFGNSEIVSVGNQKLIENTYQDNNGNLSISEYGNGNSVKFDYDNEDRITKTSYNGTESFNYFYDADGNLAIHKDLNNQIDYRYNYDLSGRLMRWEDSFGNLTKYSYDTNNNLSKYATLINGKSNSTKYQYDKDNRPLSVRYNSDNNNIYNQLDQNLIAYYSFDNNDATDESGNNNNGSLNGNPQFVNSTYGKAIKMDGTDDWVELTDFDVPDTFSVSMWINPYSITDGQAFIGKHTNNGGNIFLMGYWSGSSQLRIRTITDTQATKTTGYQHIVATVKKISATQTQVKYYRNNTLLWERTYNEIIGNAGGKGWTLGQEWDGNALSDFFQGEMDEVAFYDKELTSTEINELYNTPVSQNSIRYQYDSIGRLNSLLTSTGSYNFNTLYAYEEGVLTDPVLGTATTIKVSSINNNGSQISYTYDNNGNIKTIIKDYTKITYDYNEINELIKEEFKTDDTLQSTIDYTYDAGGNIRTKIETTYDPITGEPSANTVTYEYGDAKWKDKLTAYDGKTITYDAIGNPLTYDGYTYTWQHGRELAGISGNGLTTGYKYSDSGIRTQKTVNGVTTTYYLDGSQVVYEESYQVSTPNIKFNQIYYTYDSNGMLVSMNLDGVEYYYIRNAQNDIIGLYDKDGIQVAAYTYDSWGKLISIKDQNGIDITNDTNSIGYKNPYRYRGYRYDSETGLFYVGSRYYDPQIGRFINADDTEILFEDQDNLLQYNLFAYCLNNPVNMHDPDGHAAANIIGGIIGGVAGAALGILLAKQLGLTGWKKWALISAATVGGAVLGAILGPYIARIAKSMGSAIKTAAKVGTELCFVVGTPVKTDKGNVPIEQIKAGDYVYAENPETGEEGLKRVLQTFENEISKLVLISVNGEEIVTTPGHPFYVSEKGWVGADELKAGDLLVLYGGKQVAVKNVTLEPLSTPVKVYNFEVEDFHTYYVGNSSILVHNKGCGLNKLADSYLKKTLKLDAHVIKREFLGEKAKIALYDLAVDKGTGIIYIIDKAGKIIAKTYYKSK